MLSHLLVHLDLKNQKKLKAGRELKMLHPLEQYVHR